MTYLWLIKEVCGHRKAKLIENERHERPVTHMPSNLVGDIHILYPWDTFDGTQTRNGTETAAGCTEQVVQDPVVTCIAIHVSP